MRILIVTPKPPRSRQGNRITAVRWGRLLRELGHRVDVEESFCGLPCDVLIALHARRSADSIARFAALYADKPLIVALTGTDLYGDIHDCRAAKRSLDLASRLVLLQPDGIKELPQRHREKARVIFQSVEPLRRRSEPLKTAFEVCVVGHLRPVKDPFRAAMAARLLPAESRIQIVHLGAALAPEMERRARSEVASNPRYRWLGELPRWQARRRLARSRLLVLTSKMEGGANVVSEALADGVPVVSSRISGSVGMLGEDYPGYFPVGDTRALAELMRRAEQEPRFLRTLTTWCRKRAEITAPARERESWRQLLTEFAG